MSASCERRVRRRRRRGRGADRASHRAWGGQLELARTLGIARVSSRRGRGDAGRLRSGSAAVPVRVLLVRLVDGAHGGPTMWSASWIASVPLPPPRTAPGASWSTRPPKWRPGIPDVAERTRRYWWRPEATGDEARGALSTHYDARFNGGAAMRHPTVDRKTPPERRPAGSTRPSRGLPPVMDTPAAARTTR
jgi:hypothetical protein